MQLTLLTQGNEGNGATRSPVRIDLSGLPDGTTTTVTITLSTDVQSWPQVPAGCVVAGDRRSATCTLANGAHEFTLIHQSDVDVTVAADPAEGHEDPDPSNNSQTI